MRGANLPSITTGLIPTSSMKGYQFLKKPIVTLKRKGVCFIRRSVGMVLVVHNLLNDTWTEFSCPIGSRSTNETLVSIAPSHLTYLNNFQVFQWLWWLVHRWAHSSSWVSACSSLPSSSSTLTTIKTGKNIRWGGISQRLFTWNLTWPTDDWQKEIKYDGKLNMTKWCNRINLAGMEEGERGETWRRHKSVVPGETSAVRDLLESHFSKVIYQERIDSCVVASELSRLSVL